MPPPDPRGSEEISSFALDDPTIVRLMESLAPLAATDAAAKQRPSSAKSTEVLLRQFTELSAQPLARWHLLLTPSSHDLAKHWLRPRRLNRFSHWHALIQGPLAAVNLHPVIGWSDRIRISISNRERTHRALRHPSLPGTLRNGANTIELIVAWDSKVRSSLGSLAKPLLNSDEEMRFDQSSNYLLRIENQTLGQVALVTTQPQSLRTSRHQNRQAWRRVVQRGEAHRPMM